MVSICGSSKVFSSLSELSPWRSARHHKHRFSVNIRGDGQPRPGCAAHDGEALAVARRKKRRTYPELSAQHGRARLVVLAAGVGGRWSAELRACINQLAKAKARSVPCILFGRARQAWQHRWSSMLAWASARAFVASAVLGWARMEPLHRRQKSSRPAVTSQSAVRVEACLRYSFGQHNFAQ